jgi:hypothetical protein
MHAAKIDKRHPSQRRLFQAMFLGLLALSMYVVPVRAQLENCANVCTIDSDPAQACLYVPEDSEMPAFEADCETYGVYYTPGYCGDGYCGENDGEDPSNCESDCFVGPGTDPGTTPYCGNNECELGESHTSCPADCAARNPEVCGDGVCELGENVDNCPSDCAYAAYCGPDCPSGYTCRARRCVWDPMAITRECLYSAGGLSSCASNEKCAQIGNTGYGVCVPFF